MLAKIKPLLSIKFKLKVFLRVISHPARLFDTVPGHDYSSLPFPNWLVCKWSINENKKLAAPLVYVHCNSEWDCPMHT